MDFQESKDINISNIPKEWKVERLGDEKVCEIIMGQSPSSLTYNEAGDGLPFLQGNMEFGPIHPSPTVFCNKPIKIAEENDVLISVRAPVGELNISQTRVCIGRGLASIRCNPNKVSHLFLFYYLKSKAKELENISAGSTFKAIRKNDIERLSVPLPPIGEQRKIAEILSTVDQAIQKVGQAIEKTERLKKGLMQELLTKGIGHKDFKKTAIGKIPKEWQLVRLGDSEIAEIRRNKTHFNFETVAFVPMELIPDSGIFTEFKIRPLKEVRSFTYCEKGDLLLAKITPSLENGKQGIVPDDIPNGFALATTEVFPILCKRVNKLYLFYILKHPIFRNKIIYSMIGTTGRQRASKESIERLLIPLPPLPEQQKIAEILSSVDKRIETLRKRKERLEKVKRGLMEDLLTGKKRVKLED